MKPDRRPNRELTFSPMEMPDGAAYDSWVMVKLSGAGFIIEQRAYGEPRLAKPFERVEHVDGFVTYRQWDESPSVIAQLGLDPGDSWGAPPPDNDDEIDVFAADESELPADALALAKRLLGEEWVAKNLYALVDFADAVTRARVHEVERALRPFAKAAAQLKDMKPGSTIYGQPGIGVGAIATVADFRAAAAAVGPSNDLDDD